MSRSGGSVCILLLLLLALCASLVSTKPRPDQEGTSKSEEGPKEELSQESKAIALIHHLTYLIDYLVRYVLGASDRKTPQDAVNYYQTALLEGKDKNGQTGAQYRPSKERAQQEMQIINQLMKS
uniref:Putative salivary secreted peptide n=1 Tax=Anopheles darlingi TaxID=43151 RepID=B6DDY3_ANODA